MNPQAMETQRPNPPKQGEPPPAAALDFDCLYDGEFDYVCRTLRRLGARSEDLKDLAHEVFLAAYRRLATFDKARPIRPWLFGIAFRAVSEWRSKPVLAREVGPEPLAQLRVEAGAEEHLSAREARETVLLALEALDPLRRGVFILHELDGCAAPEISEALGVPLNTVYSRLRVARQEFAVAVKRISLPPGGAP